MLCGIKEPAVPPPGPSLAEKASDAGRRRIEVKE